MGTPNVIAIVVLSFTLGLALGMCVARIRQCVSSAQHRTARQALMALLTSAEQLELDADRHNNELQEILSELRRLQLTGDLGQKQQQVLHQISDVIASNQRLEDDLSYTRHCMEIQAKEIDRTRREARADALSGVANRKDFDERLQYMLACYEREHSPFVLVLADIDHFKAINDTYGHQIGDQVVSHVGALLKHYVRTADYVARYGGDEFALLLPNTDLATGERIAERIRTVLNRNSLTAAHNGEQILTTFSMGVAEIRPGDTAESLFARVDRALYHSKHCGRNKIHTCKEPQLFVQV